MAERIGSQFAVLAGMINGSQHSPGSTCQTLSRFQSDPVGSSGYVS